MCSTSRQRPTLFTDQDGSRYLFNGVAVNRTMYYHSFTFVQSINTNPSARVAEVHAVVVAAVEEPTAATSTEEEPR